MEGPEQCTSDQRGILPRTAHFLMKATKKLADVGRGLTIEGSSIEVYCEKARDLLADKQVELGTDPVTRKVTLLGQSWTKISNVEEFCDLIKLSYSRRVFAANGHHEHSSRSHHIFQVRLTGHNKSLQKQQSLLNIVDLAGSER
jgi:kinesin family member C1